MKDLGKHINVLKTHKNFVGPATFNPSSFPYHTRPQLQNTERERARTERRVEQRRRLPLVCSPASAFPMAIPGRSHLDGERR
jgi:hypothetical protein